MTLSSIGQSCKWNEMGSGKSARGEWQNFPEIPRASRNSYKSLSLAVFHDWEATSSCCDISECRKSLRTRGRTGRSFLWVQNQTFLNCEKSEMWRWQEETHLSSSLLKKWLVVFFSSLYVTSNIIRVENDSKLTSFYGYIFRQVDPS